MINHVDGGSSAWVAKFDSRAEHGTWIKSTVLANHFCGVVYFRLSSDDGSRESAVNVVLFDNATGTALTEIKDVMAYGSTYFSASERYFVFTYLDGNLCQHFIVFDYR